MQRIEPIAAAIETAVPRSLARERFRLVLALSITLVFWASAFAVIRSAVRTFSPGHMALLRFLTASVLLLAYTAFRPIRLPRLRHVPVFLLCGMAGIALYHPLLNFGEQTVSAGAACLLINTVPIWTALLASLFLHERLRTVAWLGIALSFGGIVLIALGQGQGLQFDARALCIVIAAASTSGYVVLHKKYLSEYSSLEFLCWAFLAGSLELLVVFWPGFFAAVAGASLRAQLEVVYLGVFPGALAYFTFAYATRRLSASAVTSFMYASPVLAMLIAWPYLGEIPSTLSVAGGALAIAGVVVVNRYGRAGP